jgi:hypothetical protein
VNYVQIEFCPHTLFDHFDFDGGWGEMVDFGKMGKLLILKYQRTNKK